MMQCKNEKRIFRHLFPIWSELFNILAALFLLFLLPTFSSAEVERDANASLATAPKAHLGTPKQNAKLFFEPLALPGGTSLTFVSPAGFSATTAQLKKTLHEMHRYFTRIFGSIPGFSSTVQLMETESFYAATGAPRWANALFYNEKILLPVERGDYAAWPALSRSLKHEYTHAITDALSGGNCPGWLDEGLAQWAEGSENPGLRPALERWLARQKPVPIKLLQGGFTQLPTDMVPAAYAQSLFATNFLIQKHGLRKVGKFLSYLRRGKSQGQSFHLAFGNSIKNFEGKLHHELETWYQRARKQKRAGGGIYRLSSR